MKKQVAGTDLECELHQTGVRVYRDGHVDKQACLAANADKSLNRDDEASVHSFLLSLHKKRKGDE